MKFNKEKTKKFASGGKSPKEIMEEARRNQAIERSQAAADVVHNSGIPAFQSQQVAINVPRPTVELTAPNITQRSDLKSMFKTRGEAFNYARKQGWNDFNWGGGRFHTKTAEEVSRAETEQSTESSGTTSQQSPQVSIGNTANTLFVGANRTTPIFNTNSGLDLSRLFIPEGQQYGQSQEDTEDTEDTEGKTSRVQLLEIGNPTNTRFNINPNFRNGSGLDLSRLVLPPVLPIRTSAATTVANRFNTPIIQLGKNPVSRNPYYRQGGQLPAYNQGGQILKYQAGAPIYRRNLWERFWNIKPKAQPVLESGNESTRKYRDGNTDIYEIIKEVPYGNLTSTMEVKSRRNRPDTLYRSPKGEEFKSKDIKKNPSLQSYPNKFNRYFKYQQGGTIAESGPTDEMYVDFAVRFLSKLGVGEQDMVDEEGGLKDEHTETVTAALQELEANPEFWDTYVSDPDAAVDAYIESKQSPEQVEMARKGAKLKKLQKLKKGTAKKCKCGCDLIIKKEKGGTITEVCSCGCKAK